MTPEETVRAACTTIRANLDEIRQVLEQLEELGVAGAALHSRVVATFGELAHAAERTDPEWAAHLVGEVAP